jgi:hypothetical protein
MFALEKILHVLEEARVGCKAIFIYGDFVTVIRKKLLERVGVLEIVTSIGVAANDVEEYTYIYNKTGAQCPLWSGGIVRFDSAADANVRWRVIETDQLLREN